MREIEPIAVIYTAFPCKFGIPRQSGLTGTEAQIVFEKKYADPEALRGIEEYSHLWLIWNFSQSLRSEFSPTVRPPRLGGNERRGVFATRSPFRPNGLGLSCVRLLRVDRSDPRGPVLYVSGADILSGTEIYDIKPYIPYADSVPDAFGGFAERAKDEAVEVVFACDVPVRVREGLREILAQDPRPHYKSGEEKTYSFEFDGCSVKILGAAGVITVLSVTPLAAGGKEDMSK